MYTLMLCILVHTFNFISITVFLPFGDSCIMSKEQFKNIGSLYRKFVVQRYERQSCLPRNFPTGSGGKLQMPK